MSLFTVVALLPLASPASAEAAFAPIVADASITVKDGKATPQVRLLSATADAKVEFRLRLKGATEPYAVVPDVPFGYGIPGQGAVWARQSPTDLKPGRTYLDLTVSDPSGGRLDVPQAAFIDSPAGVFTVSGLGVRTVTSAFTITTVVAHSGPVSKIVARLYRRGTAEQVGEDVVPTLRSTLKYSTYTRSDYAAAFDPPVGDYEVAISAWDEQGDVRTTRTSVISRKLVQRLVDLRSDPTWTDVNHPDATITGRVVDPAGQPLSGVTVGSGAPRTTTAEDGTFSLNVKATQDHVGVVALEHGDYAEASAQLAVERRPVNTRMIITASTAKAHAGDTIKLSGQLDVADLAGWRPFPGRTVSLFFWDGAVPGKEIPAGSAVTDANGRYSVNATVPGNGTWIARFNPALIDPDYWDSSARTDIRADFATQILAVGKPASPAAYRSSVTMTGQVVRRNAPSAQVPVRNGFVHLQFSADGKNWVNKGDASTDANGRFRVSGLASADGHWRARFEGNTPSHGSWDDPSTTASFYVDTKYKTAITSFDASPEPVKKGRTLTVKGKITKFTGAWQPAAGAALTIYFKPKGSTKWKAMGTTKSDRNGRFTKAFKASADGTWAAAYAGSSTYLGIWSAGDYVDVR
ncbi:hypothetical protein EBO15_21620 [Actinomadura harenae]|uniref:Carboxypeptidase regulatory-like domain-containing protein n=1 Tax=Actinomadura harenae TaxID=2483351 RepID=A0A3M2LXG8_9ACTN|nr:hypothetical protein EBO15_21620 [Actinomadura harenae]